MTTDTPPPDYAVDQVWRPRRGNRRPKLIVQLGRKGGVYVVEYPRKGDVNPTYFTASQWNAWVRINDAVLSLSGESSVRSK